MSQPAHTTAQEAAILKHLQAGKTITCLEAYRLFGSLALHSRIFAIRKETTVRDEWITVKSRGVIKHVKRYWIEKTA